jgi:hypothetical protein
MNSAISDRFELDYALLERGSVLGVNMYAIGHALAEEIRMRDTHPPVSTPPKQRDKPRLRRRDRAEEIALAAKRAQYQQDLPFGGCYPSDS